MPAKNRKKETIDYDYHEKRTMCDGCPGCVYAVPPSMYVRADECPVNPRYRRPGFVKVYAGQGKTKAGGNR